MDDMIERVARVLYTERMRLWAETSPKEAVLFSKPWEKENEAYRDQIRREARAAIEAMRLPLDALLAEQPIKEDTLAGLDLARELIDAALSPPPPSSTSVE